MDDNNISQQNKLKKLRNRMILTYTLLICAVFIIVSAFFMYSYNQVLDKQAKNYVSFISLQIQKSLNNYIEEVEEASVGIYDDKTNIDYYPQDRYQDKSYADLQLEQKIENEMISLVLMDNYCDFGIIYKNGHSLGKISDGTLDIFDNKLFSTFNEEIGENSTIWITNYNENYSRLYFVKKLTDKSLLLTSIYTAELDSIFRKTDTSSNIKIFLTTANDRVLYTSDKSYTKIGADLPNEIKQTYNGVNNSSIISSDYIGAVTQAKTDWKVYFSIPTYSITKLGSESHSWIITLGFVVFIVCICLGFISAGKYLHDEDAPKFSFKNKDEIDNVTGLLNSLGIDEKISDRIETCLMGSTFAFIIIKIKDFDEIKLRLGSNYTDNVLIKLTQTLTGSFNKKDIVGFNENNEFVIFAEFTDFDLFKAHNMVKEKCNQVSKNLNNFYAGNEREHKIYMGMGVCVYPENGRTYEELYENTSAALNISLKSEKDTCVFYDTLKNARRGHLNGN